MKKCCKGVVQEVPITLVKFNYVKEKHVYFKRLKKLHLLSEMSQRNVFVEKMLVTYKLCSVPASLQVLRPGFGAPHVLELIFLFPHAIITALKKNTVPNMKGTNSRFGPV